ncbi:hypothetical protein BP6252_08277 [Coleophoma cylindrospora]|uniref:Major facilitator superfamily (MFS) profile domain-containing protein n=1 Tax=Coleophoma cylindrospora TaxID=1849047 RepID=A0A3D8R5I3_9HELO|nr:hypothetical protein BP6252_08277 [Coleophoma cylindrospora]
MEMTSPAAVTLAEPTISSQERDIGLDTAASSMEKTSIPMTKADMTFAALMIARPEPVEFEEGDEGNPRNWTISRKCIIAAFATYAASVAVIGAPIYTAAITSIEIHFHVGTTLAIAPLSLYSYGIGFGALLGTAACEIMGRRIVYRVTFPLALIFTIVGGSAQNFATLAVSRTLAGAFAGPSLAVGVGVMNDLWNVSLDKLGTTFSVLYAVFLIFGTQIGPMASASLLRDHSWRWTLWVLAILLGTTAIGAVIVPETYAPEIQRSRAKKSKLSVTNRGASVNLFLASVGRPLHMLLVEPLVLPSGLVLAVTQSVVFAYYIAYALLFEEVYNFTQFQVGMTFGALVVGSILAVPVMGIFDRLTYQKAREAAIRSGTTVLPEKRLYPAMLSVILFPISLFWLAWSGRPHIHWVAPVLSGVLFGLAYVINMMVIPAYNNEVYAAHYGPSVMAATTFLRFTVSSCFPLFTPQMVNKLGISWAITLLGFIAVAMIPIPWVFFKWGPVLRSKSRYLKD